MIYTNHTRAISEVSQAAEPVSLAEAKLWLKMDDLTIDDSLIEGLIVSARIECERGSGLAIPKQTIEDLLNSWPEYDLNINKNRSFRLLRYPVISVTSVKYYDSDGVEKTVPAADYNVTNGSNAAVIAIIPGKSWPANDGREGGIKVTYEAGWNGVDKIPGDIKTAMKLMLNSHYQNRQDSVQRYRSAAMNILKKRYVHIL